MKARLILALAALALPLGFLSCGGGSSSEKACTEVFAEGAQPPTGDFVPCKDENGKKVNVAVLRVEFSDTCKIRGTDYGWWYEGKTVTTGEYPGAEEVLAGC